MSCDDMHVTREGARGRGWVSVNLYMQDCVLRDTFKC